MSGVAISRVAAPTPPVTAVALALALVGGVLLLTAPALAIPALAAGYLVVAVYFHPPLAAYTLIALTPLIAGIDRGSAIPVLRPNEALLLLVAAPFALRALARVMSGHVALRVTTLDWSIVALAVTSSVLPLAWMAARRHNITSDDVLYALTLWKYLGLYALIRVSVRTEREVRRCLWISMGAAAIVAVIGILQALGLAGVPALMAHYFSPTGDASAIEAGRGTSTLGSAFSMADIMTFNLAISTGLLVRGHRRRPLLLALSLLFVLGALGSGQFSGAIGLVVGLVTVGWLTRTLTRGAVASIPAIIAAGVVMQPVLAKRLSGFHTSAGLPSSWVSRLDNLRRFFWPQLAHYNWILGVRPSARVPAPHAEWWRDWVWIESGHTWLLWNGGVPLLLSYVAFVWTAVKRSAALARARVDAVGVAAIAACTAVVVMTVLTTFDPHLTLRGSADLLFVLLALTFAAPRSAQGDAVGEVSAVTVDG